jgi:hypothetical protein
MRDERSQTCSHCRQQLPISAFARQGEGVQVWCRNCKKEYDAAWYKRNRSKRRAKVKADRQSYGEWLDSLKEGKRCLDCGQAYPSYVLEWDHLPDAVKTLVVSDTRRAAFSKKRILEELEGCELVCANCHRERTFGDRKGQAA